MAVTDGISTTWLLIYTALGLISIHQLYNFTYFLRKGIKGPLPLPLIGNYLSLGLKGFLPTYTKWTRKYGDTFGIYFGGQRTLVLGNADVARLITVKDFSSFQKRNLDNFVLPNMEEGILTAHGEPWKRGRSYMSPAFSGSKMKQMLPLINNNCNALMEVLDKKAKAGESFETKYVYGSYVLDNVASCAFGINADCLRNPDDPFLKYAKQMQIDASNLGLMARVMTPSFLAPVLDNIRMFDVFPKAATDFFGNIINQALELRKGSSGEVKTKDFIQLMIESSEGGDEDENGSAVGEASKKKIPATAGELMGNSMAFFLAGYDTVSSTLAVASFALASYPEVQQKVQEEIDEHCGSEGDVDYDSVGKLEYLEKVWCESQRMWPAGFILERVCNQETTVNGLTIHDGDYMHINVWNLHHSDKYWDNPETFNPENFSKEAKESRHPAAWMPFGFGPRNCIGMRFAILESKVMLVHMLRKYTMRLDPKTKDIHDSNNFGSTDIYPKTGIHVNLLPRSEE